MLSAAGSGGAFASEGLSKSRILWYSIFILIRLEESLWQKKK